MQQERVAPLRRERPRAAFTPPRRKSGRGRPRGGGGRARQPSRKRRRPRGTGGRVDLFDPGGRPRRGRPDPGSIHRLRRPDQGADLGGVEHQEGIGVHLENIPRHVHIIIILGAAELPGRDVQLVIRVRGIHWPKHRGNGGSTSRVLDTGGTSAGRLQNVAVIFFESWSIRVYGARGPTTSLSVAFSGSRTRNRRLVRLGDTDWAGQRAQTYGYRRCRSGLGGDRGGHGVAAAVRGRGEECRGRGGRRERVRREECRECGGNGGCWLSRCGWGCRRSARGSRLARGLHAQGHLAREFRGGLEHP
ncbi:hypothetical protein OH77DRAFT_619648 [Trametes cingulata]|nr:hypothetical protein OH77DRAFT_619648 [Trametes cingulata]